MTHPPVKYTWTTHTFVCSACHRLCRASQEAVDEARREGDYGNLTDAQVAQFDFCLSCVAGIDAPGEKVPQCEGELDDAGNPICFGADVRPVLFRDPQDEDKEWIEARWCADCRLQGAHIGYDVAIVENGAPKLLVGFRGEAVRIPLDDTPEDDATGARGHATINESPSYRDAMIGSGRGHLLP